MTLKVCTSGRKIAVLQNAHEPCGRTLEVVGSTRKGSPVLACPACDNVNNWPSQRRER